MESDWIAEVKEGWQEQLRREGLARVALRKALEHDAGPWRYRELEGKVVAQGEVALPVVHTALWTMINAGEAVLTATGIERGVLSQVDSSQLVAQGS